MMFRVYYDDGNVKLFEATDMADLMSYLLQVQGGHDIDKIERVA